MGFSLLGLAEKWKSALGRERQEGAESSSFKFMAMAMVTVVGDKLN